MPCAARRVRGGSFLGSRTTSSVVNPAESMPYRLPDGAAALQPTGACCWCPRPLSRHTGRFSLQLTTQTRSHVPGGRPLLAMMWRPSPPPLPVFKPFPTEQKSLSIMNAPPPPSLADEGRGVLRDSRTAPTSLFKSRHLITPTYGLTSQTIGCHFHISAAVHAGSAACSRAQDMSSGTQLSDLICSG